jgi:hypothetical protein
VGPSRSHTHSFHEGGAASRVIRKVSREGGIDTFLIDSKKFTLGFNGGHRDPYHIMERQGRFRGSLWVGLGGLCWLLDLIAKVRNSTPSLEGFFEFFRDGYRVIEISCLSNHGGRFLEVSEYHSSAHQGSIRIPEGRRGAGWSLFEFQVCKFFLREIVVPEHVQAAGFHAVRNGKMHQSRNSRKSRVIMDRERFAPKQSITNTNRVIGGRDSRSRIILAKKEPRPPRAFHFVWKPKAKTLHITIGSRREVEWVWLESHFRPKAASGPHSLKLQLEAQQAEMGVMGSLEVMKGDKAHLVGHCCLGESSGTKLGSPELSSCNSLYEEEDSESELPDEPPCAVADDLDADAREEVPGDSRGYNPTHVLPVAFSQVAIISIDGRQQDLREDFSQNINLPVAALHYCAEWSFSESDAAHSVGVDSFGKENRTSQLLPLVQEVHKVAILAEDVISGPLESLPLVHIDGVMGLWTKFTVGCLVMIFSGL